MRKIIITFITLTIIVGCKKDELSSSTPKEDLISYIDYVDEYGVNHGKGVAIDSVIWAPVNCGYKVATSNDNGYPYGKLYQWGRKYGQGYSGLLYNDINPGVMNGLPNGEAIRISDASTPDLDEGRVSEIIGNMEINANVFYCGYPNWANPRSDKLYNSGLLSEPIKSDYDPCPVGWRVPTPGELNKLYQNHSSLVTNDSDQMGRWFSGLSSYTEDVPQIFLPAAGCRHYYDGQADDRGSRGFYWSSMLEDSLYAYILAFDCYSSVSLAGGACAAGFSIRCVQE